MKPSLTDRLFTGIVSRCVGTFMLFALAQQTDHAQLYMLDPKIDINTAANTYFGSTKDSEGRFLSGVTVEFTADNTSYVMVTDEAGRFKVHIPKYFSPAEVKFNCSKPGYGLVRSMKRPPPKGTLSPVQADCILAPKSDGAK